MQRHRSIAIFRPMLFTALVLALLPLPLATVRIHVFNDINNTNGEFDTPGEPGLAGFQGHIHDVLGEVTTDWFNNPLCTQYQKDANGCDCGPEERRDEGTRRAMVLGNGRMVSSRQC